MDKPTKGPPTRRQVMASLAIAAAAAASTAPIARIVGTRDRPYASKKFTGPGWYAFGTDGGGSPKRVLWAYRDGHPFIALSDGEGHPVVVYLSHRRFDQTCWGTVCTVPTRKREARNS